MEGVRDKLVLSQCISLSLCRYFCPLCLAGLDLPLAPTVGEGLSGWPPWNSTWLSLEVCGQLSVQHLSWHHSSSGLLAQNEEMARVQTKGRPGLGSISLHMKTIMHQGRMMVYISFLSLYLFFYYPSWILLFSFFCFQLLPFCFYIMNLISALGGQGVGELLLFRELLHLPLGKGVCHTDDRAILCSMWIYFCVMCTSTTSHASSICYHSELSYLSQLQGGRGHGAFLLHTTCDLFLTWKWVRPIRSIMRMGSSLFEE